MRRVGIIELLMGASTFTCDGLNMCRLYLQVMLSSQTGAGLCRDGSDGHVCITSSRAVRPVLRGQPPHPQIGPPRTAGVLTRDLLADVQRGHPQGTHPSSCTFMIAPITIVPASSPYAS